MKIVKSTLNNTVNAQERTKNVLARASAGKDISSTPLDVSKHLRTLLIDKGLTLEYILERYKDVVDMKLKGTRVADVVKVLESLTRLHLVDSSNLSEVQRALESKDVLEIAEYTRITLKETESVLERIQTRKINQERFQNAPERA